MNFLSNTLKVLGFLPSMITAAESLFGPRSGQQKKNHVLDMARLTMQVREAVAAEEIVDETRFNAGLQLVIDGMAEMFNASAWHKGKAVS